MSFLRKEDVKHVSPGENIAETVNGYTHIFVCTHLENQLHIFVFVGNVVRLLSLNVFETYIIQSIKVSSEFLKRIFSSPILS